MQTQTVTASKTVQLLSSRLPRQYRILLSKCQWLLSHANIVLTKSIWCSFYKVLGVSFTSLVLMANLLDGVNGSFDLSNQLAGSTSEALDQPPNTALGAGGFALERCWSFWLLKGVLGLHSMDEMKCLDGYFGEFVFRLRERNPPSPYQGG